MLLHAPHAPLAQVHQYDIVMDVTVINRTNETIQNLCLELATMGDLKLVERPQNYTLAPGDTKTIRANIKVLCLLRFGADTFSSILRQCVMG